MNSMQASHYLSRRGEEFRNRRKMSKIRDFVCVFRSLLDIYSKNPILQVRHLFCPDVQVNRNSYIYQAWTFSTHLTFYATYLGSCTPVM